MAAKMRPVFQVLQHVLSRCMERTAISTLRTRPLSFLEQWPQRHPDFPVISLYLRHFSTTTAFGAERSAAVHGEKVKHNGSLDRKIGEAKELQTRTPWHRDGADQPPVKRLRSAGAMTKGKLC